MCALLAAFPCGVSHAETADPIETFFTPLPLETSADALPSTEQLPNGELSSEETATATPTPTPTPAPTETRSFCESEPWPTEAQLNEEMPEELKQLLAEAGPSEAPICLPDDEQCLSEESFAESLIDSLVGTDMEYSFGEANNFSLGTDSPASFQLFSTQKSYDVYERTEPLSTVTPSASEPVEISTPSYEIEPASTNLISTDAYRVEAEVSQDAAAQEPVPPAPAPGQSPAPANTPAPTPPAQPSPQPSPSPTVGCDQKRDQWGCFCFYSPPGGPYNGNEQRFADACLNAMGDPRQPDRWSPWYNCKEIRSFRMLRGPGGTVWEGFEEWIRRISAGENGVKCFRGFMYSHSNGCANFVNDRTQPIEQCIRSGDGVRCMSLHDCGCSTAANSRTICNRAQELSRRLREANSSMVVHFDAAEQDQALPGGLQQVDKSRFCAGNPDGWVVDEFYWRRAYITRGGVWIYRHDRQQAPPPAPGAPRPPARWRWVKYTDEQFRQYCAGNDPCTTAPRPRR